jgi:hypothetical protein
MTIAFLQIQSHCFRLAEAAFGSPGLVFGAFRATGGRGKGGRSISGNSLFV